MLSNLPLEASYAERSEAGEVAGGEKMHVFAFYFITIGAQHYNIMVGGGSRHRHRKERSKKTSIICMKVLQ